MTVNTRNVPGLGLSFAIFHPHVFPTPTRVDLFMGRLPLNTMRCRGCHNAAAIALLALVVTVGAGVKASWIYTAGGGRRGGVPLWAAEAGVEVNSLLYYIWCTRHTAIYYLYCLSCCTTVQSMLLSAVRCYLIKSCCILCYTGSKTWRQDTIFLVGKVEGYTT